MHAVALWSVHTTQEKGLSLSCSGKRKNIMHAVALRSVHSTQEKGLSLSCSGKRKNIMHTVALWSVHTTQEKGLSLSCSGKRKNITHAVALWSVRVTYGKRSFILSSREEEPYLAYNSFVVCSHILHYSQQLIISIFWYDIGSYVSNSFVVCSNSLQSTTDHSHILERHRVLCIQ